jgi:membrane protein implicated in regulation of membrane protease activity
MAKLPKLPEDLSSVETADLRRAIDDVEQVKLLTFGSWVLVVGFSVLMYPITLLSVGILVPGVSFNVAWLMPLMMVGYLALAIAPERRRRSKAALIKRVSAELSRRAERLERL